MSSSTCISSNSTFKPKSDSRFSKPMDSSGGGSVRVVDSKSCRQMYLRTAYTFSRQEEKKRDGNMEKAKKCLGRVRDSFSLVYKRYDHMKSFKYMIRNNSVGNNNNNNNNGSMVIFSKVKEFSYSSLLSMIRRMLACTAKVDVAEH